MMQRELNYQVPIGRLIKLSRSAGRKAFRTTWMLTWILVVVVVAAVFSLVFWGDAFNTWMRKVGVPYGVELALASLWVLLLAGILVLRRARIRQIRDRADYDQVIRLTRDNGGIRIATANIEYYLKWSGISQLLLEHDGVVISHGNLFILVPNSAFADDGERREFIRDIFGRMSQKAQSISQKHVRTILDDSKP
jgi:uncharacterized membrane protein